MIKKIAGKATQNPFHSRKIVRKIAQIPFHASTPTAVRRRRPCPPWAGRPAQVPRKEPTTTIQKEVVIQPVHGRLHHRGSRHTKAIATAQERSVQPVAVSSQKLAMIRFSSSSDAIVVACGTGIRTRPAEGGGWRSPCPTMPPTRLRRAWL